MGRSGPRQGEVVALLGGDRTTSERMTCGGAQIESMPGMWQPHQHAKPEEYHFLSGTGVVQIDGTEHAVRTGSTVFIHAIASHGVRNTGSEPPRLFYVFAVDSFTGVEYLFPS